MNARPTPHARLPADAGLALKPQHFRDALESPHKLGFFEVHAENYMVAGGPFHHHLGRVRERFALSLHGVGLSIGSPSGLDGAHLGRVASLVDRYEPASFSEHLAWSSHGGSFFNDLLPLPYDDATLNRVCDHVDQVQQRLRRTILIENPSTYLEWASSTMDEAQFLRELVRRSGCGLLLDVNNAYVSAVNHHRDLRAFVSALPLQAVGEIHLAGFAEDRDAAGERLLIDAHGTPVDDAVWSLYRHVLTLTGPVPTLIERDTDVPPFERLVAEADMARDALGACTQRRSEVAA